MRAGNDARTNAIRNPGTIDVIANLGCDTHQVPRLYTDTRGIDRMYPDRVIVRYLIQPPGIARSCVDERRQAKCGNEQVFTAFAIDSGTMDMTANIAGSSIF